MFYDLIIFYRFLASRGDNGCVKFAETATQTVNLTNLLSNLDPNLANCNNIMTASFLDHISISALATSPPATSALHWNGSNQQEQQLLPPNTHNINNNNNLSTINNNNNNNSSLNSNPTSSASNNVTHSRRSSIDAITTNIGWVVNDAAVPRSNSCSSTSNNTRFHNAESTGKIEKCELNETAPTIDHIILQSPTQIGTDELVVEPTKNRSNHTEVDAATYTDEDGDGASTTSEHTNIHSDGINNSASNL